MKMKRLINGKTYHFMFIVLPSGNQGLMYKIEGDNKVYQVFDHYFYNLELVEKDIKKGKVSEGIPQEEWDKWYNKSCDEYSNRKL